MTASFLAAFFWKIFRFKCEHLWSLVPFSEYGWMIQQTQPNNHRGYWTLVQFSIVVRLGPVHFGVARNVFVGGNRGQPPQNPGWNAKKTSRSKDPHMPLRNWNTWCFPHLLYKGRLDNAGDKELIVRIQLGQLASIGASRYQDVYHRVTVEYWSRIAEPNVRVGNDSRDPPRTKKQKRERCHRLYRLDLHTFVSTCPTVQSSFVTMKLLRGWEITKKYKRP